MKIVQTCDEKPSPAAVKCHSLSLGTVFKAKFSTAVWVRTEGGFFNLNLNLFSSNSSFNTESCVDLVYPNARIVLE